jgi:hypothetical protein
MYKLIFIFIIFLFIIFLLYDLIKKNMSYDTFSPYNGVNNYMYYPNNIQIEYPFWNSTRSTRGMSYDLRGDVPIPYFMNLPFNMSSRIPIQNRTLSDIS